jgi:hypothetical protein
MERFGSGLEQLYYASQRTGVAVNRLSDLSFAAGQVGSSADIMQEALGTLRHDLAIPGVYEAYIKQITGFRGQIRSAADALPLLLKHWRELIRAGQEYRFWPEATVLGLDPEKMRRLAEESDKLKLVEDERRVRWLAMGVDEQHAAEQSVRLMDSFRRLWDTLHAIGVGFFSQFADPLTRALDNYVIPSLVRLEVELHKLPPDMQAVAQGVGGLVVAFGAWKTLRGLMGFVGLGGGRGAAAPAGGGGGRLARLAARGPLYAVIAGIMAEIYAYHRAQAARESADEWLGKPGTPGAGPSGMMGSGAPGAAKTPSQSFFDTLFLGGYQHGGRAAQTGAALLHQGEIVLPPALSNALWLMAVSGSQDRGMRARESTDLLVDWLHGMLNPAVRIVDASGRDIFGPEGYGPGTGPGGRPRHGDPFGLTPRGDPSVYGRGAGGIAPGAIGESMNFWIGKGLSPMQAAAMTGRLIGESALNPMARNPSGHVGLPQWDVFRATRAFGSPEAALHATRGQQLEAFFKELQTDPKEHRAWTALLGAKSLPEALEAIEMTERGGLPHLGLRAAQDILQHGDYGPQVASGGGRGGHNITIDNRTHIQVAATELARGGALEEMIRRQNADMVRNLSGAVR